MWPESELGVGGWEPRCRKWRLGMGDGNPHEWGTKDEKRFEFDNIHLAFSSATFRTILFDYQLYLHLPHMMRVCIVACCNIRSLINIVLRETLAKFPSMSILDKILYADK